MSNIYNFYHSKWVDKYVLEDNIKKIYKENDKYNSGFYSNNGNEIIINWNKNKDINDNIFIKIYDGYYDKNFFIKYIQNFKLFEIKLFQNDIFNNFIINFDKKIIFQKNNLKNIGTYKIVDIYIYITWYNDIDKDNIYIKLENIYYSYKYLATLLNKINYTQSTEQKNDIFGLFEQNNDKNNNIITSLEQNNDKNNNIITSLEQNNDKNYNTTTSLEQNNNKNNKIITSLEENNDIKKDDFFEMFSNIEHNNADVFGLFEQNNCIIPSINNINSMNDCKDIVENEQKDDFFEIFTKNENKIENNKNNNLINKDLIDFSTIDILNSKSIYKLTYNSRQKYRLINDKYIFINEKSYNYKITNIIMNNDIITQNLQKMIDKNSIENKNYINKIRVENYISESKNVKNELEYMLNLNLPFGIEIKSKKRILSLVEWGYPPFGGGENWTLNLNKMLYKNNYDNYLICFSDPFKKEYFNEFKKIDLKYVQIIQMPKDILLIIKIIKLIDPDIINHQGIHREYFMKISNLLEIPFLTGFCFWNNIIKLNKDNANVNMINNKNLAKEEEFEFILNNSYNYVASEFVNDIISNVYNKKLDVIETISLKEDFIVENNDEQKYVTIINCHYNKGGFLIENLCKILNKDIPLLFIYTENDPFMTYEKVEELVNYRNTYNNVNILINGKVDIKNIYKKTKILLVPSICDETFCRVAYEGMMNNIPIISRENGNLKYLLKDYAIFLNTTNNEIWMKEIESLYFDTEKLNSFKYKFNSNLSQESIEDKLINKFKSIKESKYKLNSNNIGLIVPWADQGLGIQSRDYYSSLKELGYNPHIFSFKPYHATYDNMLLQTDKDEWNYKNIFYSSNYREDIELEEIINFIYKYNIKNIIIIEASFLNIFKIAILLKIMKINIYLIINIECIRLNELQYHNVFDKILANNLNSYQIIKEIFPDKAYYLNFHLNYSYFQKIEKKEKKTIDKIKFCCFGGLNSLSRKNIDKIIKSFYEIYNDNIYLQQKWVLNVYIQGVEVPNIVKNFQCPNITYNINNLSYKSIIDKYFENDISIHLGSHEGLGLGFYEALYTGTPILTLNWTPNNEIITNNFNGWIIDCNYAALNDNSEGVIHRGVLDETDLKNKIYEILNDNNNTLNIINNTIIDKKRLFKKNKDLFNKNFIEILK